MKAKIKIELLSNTIFGSGKSVPGAEDISILLDSKGFPYLKGTTFKGIFREEVENILDWTGNTSINVDEIFGERVSTQQRANGSDRFIFTDFVIPSNIKDIMLGEQNYKMSKDIVADCFTSEYTFTAIENGMIKKGSLRSCKCINKGNIFYGEIIYDEKYADIVKMGVKAIKFMGSMRTRGFGRVKVSIEQVVK